MTALEEEGLARREPVAGDRRLVRVRATARGAHVMRAGRRRRVEALSTLFAGVTDAELQTLDRAADILARALERPPAG